MFDAGTWLLVNRRRGGLSDLRSQGGGTGLAGPYARVTGRLAESVGRLCKVLSIKQVAEHFNLRWDAVKAIDRATMEAELGAELHGWDDPAD